MLRQGRGPVVTAGHVHVEPILVIEAGQAIQRVDLFLRDAERCERRAVGVRQGVDAGNDEPADDASVPVEVVHAGVTARVDGDSQVLEERPGAGDEEVAVGLAMRLAHVEESAPVIG